jgi:hypothetical protein
LGRRERETGREKNETDRHTRSGEQEEEARWKRERERGGERDRSNNC